MNPDLLMLASLTVVASAPYWNPVVLRRLDVPELACLDESSWLFQLTPRERQLP